MSDNPDIWYRYDASYWGEGAYVCIQEMQVLSRTAKGVWVCPAGFPMLKKFCLLTSHKKFAYPTPAEAMTSFIARKERHVIILAEQLKRARLALAVAKGEVQATPRPDWFSEVAA